jgi:hypothetical protein
MDNNKIYPLIARVAGLPAETLAPFASERCCTEVARLIELQESTRGVREALVQEIHQEIVDAPPLRRRSLLDLRRDAAQGRTLRKYRRQTERGQLLGHLVDRIEEIVALEEQVVLHQKQLEKDFEDQKERECRHLIELSQDPRFLRGLAHGSLVLVDNIPRLTRTPSGQYGRRERRLQESLLRYVSRAAVKLSPLSTLTTIGLGVADAETTTFRLVGSRPWRERTLICVRRYFLDQCCDLLTRCPAFRAELDVVLNDTVERQQDDLYRLLRPGRWEHDTEKLSVRFNRPALVKVRLRGPLIEWLLEVGSSQWSYRRLLKEALLQFPYDSGSELRATVDELLRVGFLRFVWPWPSDEFRLEQRVLGFIESLPADPLLANCADVLRRLIDLLNGYPHATSPGHQAAEVKQEVFDLRQTVARLSGVVWEIKEDAAEHYFQEDVLLLPPPGESACGEVVRLPLSAAQRIVHNIEPLVRLCNLSTTRFDFLHSLGAFMSSQWPGQVEVGFLDVFDSVHHLFQEYIRVEVANRSSRSIRAVSFNPMKLAIIDQVSQWRQQTLDRLADSMEQDGDQIRLCRQSLTKLLDEVPSPYSDSRDFCAFVQPADRAAEQWVLNTCFEGAGRMGSRYTGVMDERMRETWTSYFIERATFWQGEERVELVDLFCPAGHTLNVHSPQTPRTLEIAGSSLSLPDGRTLRLRDLRVRYRKEDAVPRLVDAQGNVILPVHVGGLVFRYMPHLLKFLTVFGLGEFQFFFPPRKVRHEGDMRVADRLLIDNVVCLRKRWSFETEPLRAILRGLTDANAFIAINQWRMNRELGPQLFLMEPLGSDSPNPRLKPQYIDFRSPHCVALFRSVVSSDVSRLYMTEALPRPEDLPLDAKGGRWAVELQLDSFGLSALASHETFVDCESQLVTAQKWAK